MARHSREGGNPTDWRCAGALSFDVIPAKAGIHFDLRSESQGFRCRCAPAGNFLCWCKESHQRNTFLESEPPQVKRASKRRVERNSVRIRPPQARRMLDNTASDAKASVGFLEAKREITRGDCFANSTHAESLEHSNAFSGDLRTCCTSEAASACAQQSRCGRIRTELCFASPERRRV